MTGIRNSHPSRFNAAAVRAFAVVAVAALALTACRAEEQGRVVQYEPGVYKGKPDTQIADGVREELRNRARLQGDGSAAAPVAGGKIKMTDDHVRPPEDAANRIKNQAGAK